MLESNEELNRKFATVIRTLGEHDKYFKVVFDELDKLSNPPASPHRQIGFATKDTDYYAKPALPDPRCTWRIDVTEVNAGPNRLRRWILKPPKSPTLRL